MYACILLAVLSLAEIRVKQTTRHKSGLQITDGQRTMSGEK